MYIVKFKYARGEGGIFFYVHVDKGYLGSAPNVHVVFERPL